MNLYRQFLLPFIVKQSGTHEPPHASGPKPCYVRVGVYANEGSVLCSAAACSHVAIAMVTPAG